MNTYTTSSVSVQLALSKKDILQRLLEAGHITFDEMWTLSQDEKIMEFRHQQEPYPQPIYWTPEPNLPPNWIVTCSA